MALPRTRSEAERDLPGKAFQELDPAWKNDIAAVRPAKGRAFTDEQKAMLKGFYLVVPPGKLQEFRDLQAGRTIRIEPVLLSDTWLIAADSLTDIREGENFHRLAHLISTFRFVLVPDDAWPAPTLP